MDNREKQFLSLVAEHKGILFKVGKMYMDNLEDQEDLHQEIIAQLWKSYGSFKGESEFSSWMYRVAVNTAITYFKKEKRRSSTFTNEISKEPVSEPYNTQRDEQLAIFYKAIQHISPVEKAVILYFMEGMSHKEIAAQLGLTEVNARVKLNRTKEKIQNIIKHFGYES